MRPQVNSVPWMTFVVALLGLAWCGYTAFPTANAAPCATSGCALFRDTRIAGISLWWVGGAYFFLQAVLCLRGNTTFARLIAMLALFADAVLLVIMFLTAPCFDCLVVAVFFALTYLTLRRADTGWVIGEVRASLLLPIWFGFFIGNAVLAANEQLPLYSVGNSDNNEVRLFFSPSCPACRQAIASLGDTAALYPVMEKDGDFHAIMRFTSYLENNVPVEEALRKSLNEAEGVPQVSAFGRMLLGIKLMRNKAALLKQGFRALPLIQINGMPGYRPTSIESTSVNMPPRRPQSGQSTRPAQTGADLPGFLEGADDLQQCGGANTQPCD